MQYVSPAHLARAFPATTHHVLGEEFPRVVPACPGLVAGWAALEQMDFFKQPKAPKPTTPLREALLKLLQGLRDEASNAPLAYANPRRAAEYIQSIELEAAVDFFIVDHIRPLEEYKAMYEGLCK